MRIHFALVVAAFAALLAAAPSVAQDPFVYRQCLEQCQAFKGRTCCSETCNYTACIADKTKTNMGHRGTRMDQTDPGAWSAAMAACYPWISILQQCGGGTPGTPSVTSVAPSAPPSQPAAAEGQTGTAATAVYVYVLDGIGLVAATQNSVSTRRACEWAGGGPRPCPNSGPARSVGVLGGPYASEGAAKAAMKSKLDCQQGHWGAFINYGSGKAWLQNNITTGDCRSVKQL